MTDPTEVPILARIGTVLRSTQTDEYGRYPVSLRFLQDVQRAILDLEDENLSLRRELGR